MYLTSEYLTEAGLELFEDEWFEFYHENHGKIMYKLATKLKIMNYEFDMDNVV